jgi:hypothetical protein
VGYCGEVVSLRWGCLSGGGGGVYRVRVGVEVEVGVSIGWSSRGGGFRV